MGETSLLCQFVYHGLMMKRIILMGQGPELMQPSPKWLVGEQQLQLAGGPQLFFSIWTLVSQMLISAKKFTKKEEECWGRLRYVLVVKRERILVLEIVEVDVTIVSPVGAPRVLDQPVILSMFGAI